MSASSSDIDCDSSNANDGTYCDMPEAETEASTCMEPSQSPGRGTEIEKAALPTAAAAGAAANGSLPASADSSPQTTRDRSHTQAAKVNDEDIDPFTYRPPLTKWDYVKIIINTLWLVPLRLVFIVLPSVIMGILVCLLALICDRYDKNDPRPLSKWGRFVTNYIGTQVDRFFLFGFGFHWIHTRGAIAPAKDAPILVVSPHSCILDMFVVSLYRVPTFLARADIRRIPLIGWLIARTFRTIFVQREEQDSKTNAVREIRRYANGRGKWPQVLIFPEGTTTNRKALISFKQGAFLSKLPVQPVLIKYKNKLNTTTWSGDGLGVVGSLYLTLCQFHNSIEVEFLPVYHPSDEEMKDPKLYAHNVQHLMAKKLNIPATNHSFEDLLLMKTTRKTRLPFHSGMVVYTKANRDLNMDLRTMKKWLNRFIAMDRDKDGFIKLGDFARFLRVPNDACLRAVFNSADKAGAGILSFRSYLYGVVGKARLLIQDTLFIRSMFNFFDSDGDGVVSEDDLSSHLPFRSLPSHLGVRDNDRLQQICSDQEATVPNKMNMEQFSSLLAFHPEYALIFYECQHAGVSAPPPIANGNPSLHNKRTIEAEECDHDTSEHHMTSHMTQRINGSPAVAFHDLLLRPRSKEVCY